MPTPTTGAPPPAPDSTFVYLTPAPAPTPAHQETWHFKKEIQLGHLITTITVAVSVVLYATKIEQRIALVEQQLITQKDRDDRQDKVDADTIVLMRQSMDKIDAKLDRLMEKR